VLKFTPLTHISFLVLIIFIICWIFQEYLTLSNVSYVVTILSLGLVPVWYIWKRGQDREQAFQNLARELGDALKGLDETIYPDLKEKKFDNKSYVFMRRRLNHDFYDSMIFSGKINYLKPDLQQIIQDTFQKIKDHNKYIQKISDIEDNAEKNEDYSYKVERYYEILEKTEVSLLDEIPKRIKELEN